MEGFFGRGSRRVRVSGQTGRIARQQKNPIPQASVIRKRPGGHAIAQRQAGFPRVDDIAGPGLIAEILAKRMDGGSHGRARRHGQLHLDRDEPAAVFHQDIHLGARGGAPEIDLRIHPAVGEEDLGDVHALCYSDSWESGVDPVPVGVRPSVLQLL